MDSDTSKLGWNDKFGYCVEHEVHTDRLIQTNNTWDKFPIGKWISAQVKIYKRGNLSPEKLQALQQLVTWKKLTEKVTIKA